MQIESESIQRFDLILSCCSSISGTLKLESHSVSSNTGEGREGKDSIEEKKAEILGSFESRGQCAVCFSVRKHLCLYTHWLYLYPTQLLYQDSISYTVFQGMFISFSSVTPEIYLKRRDITKFHFLLRHFLQWWNCVENGHLNSEINILVFLISICLL